MEQEHKHHIVPIYRCKELKLTTSYKVDGKEFYFKENLVKIPRLVHALIHWGYYCKDLSPLLEHCNPPQWVIDMPVEMHPNDIKSLVRVVNLLGQEVKISEVPKGSPLIYLYNDGTVKKELR